MKWNAAQQQVLEHHTGWLQVRGPAGSGKTSVLVERWRRLSASGPAARVLVLCPSRDGADRFRQAALGQRWWAGEDLPFTTWFGAAFDLVRRHRGDRRLLTRAEQWSVVRRVLAQDGAALWPSCPDFVGRAAFVDEVASAVVALEAAGADDESVLAVAAAGGHGERWADLVAFRERYRRATMAMGALDSAQLFSEAAEILGEHSVAAAESARWDEVLIDDAEVVTPPMARVIERLAPERLVATGEEWPGIRFPRPWFAAFAWPAAVQLDEQHRAPLAVSVIRCRHPATEPDAIASLLLDAHQGGVSWGDMAVLMRRQRPRAQGIGRALARHGIPVRVTPGSAAAEPAVRALIDFFAWASGDQSGLDRLLASPAVDLDPNELRQLRRALTVGAPSSASVAGGASPGGASPRGLAPVAGVAAVAGGASPGGVPRVAGGAPLEEGALLPGHPQLAKLVVLRDRLAPRLESADPADLAHEAWLGLLPALVVDPDGDDDASGDRALDAVVAFLAGVGKRAAHDPQWRIADELALVEGPDFDPDPWIPPTASSEDESVTVATIAAARGRAWDTVVIAGCLEGELPRVSGGGGFFDHAVPEQAATREPSEWGAALPSLAERRRVSLHDERRLFAMATSRARRRVVATAAPAPGQLVSRFVADSPLEAFRRARPRVALGAFGLPAAPESEGVAPVHPDNRLSLSASRLTTYDDCPLRYFFQYTLGVRGPGGVAASMGTVVHATLAAFLDPLRTAERSWEALEACASSLWFDTGWSETIAAYQPMRDQAGRDIFSMLGDWWQAESALAEATGAWPDVVAVEYPFDITVGGHRVRGSIDRIDRVPGGIAIIDYKTGSKVPKPDEVAEDLQLATYHLAALRDPGLAAIGPPVSLRLCYLRKGAQPGQTITTEHATRTEERIIETANRILREDFEPSVDADCDYCEFWRLCPLQIQGRMVGWE